jgi:hypothetical protein
MSGSSHSVTIPFFSALLIGMMLVIGGRDVGAVPPFAQQTGQPCTTCHIGGFGPQLTPAGRAFKISGYTQSGGEGWQAQVPLAAMIITSFTSTGARVPDDQVVHHYAPNNNVALDQVSAFLAGRLGEHTGGFMQFSYSNIPNASKLDNTDLRPYTTVVDLGGSELRLGTTINNAPTVQDPYNTTYVWGFPYVTSGLAQTPAARLAVADGFVANSIGATAYAWYDRRLYLEVGAYSTISTYGLARIGNALTLGSTQGAAPYMRAAYQYEWPGQNVHLGALYFQSNVNPGAGLVSDGSNGRNHYTDYAVDAGYQFLGDGTHVVTLQGIYTHEQQKLEGSSAAFNAANGTAFGAASSLNDFRLNASYWFENTYGLLVGWRKTWGPANPVLYSPAPLTGSANSKPDSNSFIIEADWVPFGKAESWVGPWANLKLGLQYTAYTQFNGRTSNYDGFGRNASANNTILLFAWMIF